MRPPPSPTLFPYTTLFRSGPGRGSDGLRDFRAHRPGGAFARQGSRAAAPPLALPFGARPAGRGTEDAALAGRGPDTTRRRGGDRKSTRLNSSHVEISYAVF